MHFHTPFALLALVFLTLFLHPTQTFAQKRCVRICTNRSFDTRARARQVCERRRKLTGRKCLTSRCLREINPERVYGYKCVCEKPTIVHPSEEPSPEFDDETAPPTDVASIPPKGACTEGGIPCQTGYTCGCAGICTREVTFRVRAVADDAVKVFTCGGQLVGSTTAFDELLDNTFTTGCDDFLLEVTNFESEDVDMNAAAASLLVETEGSVYGTGADVPGVVKLDTTYIEEPAVGFQVGSPTFDYSSWTPTVPMRMLIDSQFPNFFTLGEAGAVPVGPSRKGSAAGTYGFRVSVPYC